MTNNKPLFNLTAAVIGTGYIGVQHLEALKSLVSDVIVCNVDEKSGKETADKYGCRFYCDYEEMFKKEKPDFVDICVPTPLHGRIALSALDSGINVLCEKPFTSTLEEAYAVTNKANEKNLSLMVAHCVRFSRKYEYLRRCIQDERFGKLLSLELYRDGPIPDWSKGGWLLDIEKSGGVVRDVHVHDTDIVKFLLGTPKSVYTKGSALCCTTLFDYGNDTLVTATASWRNARSFPFSPGFEAAFEKGVMKLHDKTFLLYTDEGITEDPHLAEDFDDYMKHGNLITNEIDYFCQCLEKGDKNDRCSAEDICKSFAISFAESESMKTNRIINLSR